MAYASSSIEIWKVFSYKLTLGSASTTANQISQGLEVHKDFVIKQRNGISHLVNDYPAKL